MANKALKGLTIKIGGDTSELLDSLKDVEKRGKSLSSELGQINKLLKLDPKNTELLAQKQKVLADAISNTEDKLGTLKEAEKQAQEQFKKGEISEQQYRALQREIIETESKLNKYKSAAKETADAVEQLGKESNEAGEEIEKQGKKTKETKEETDDLDDSADNLAAGGLAAMAAAAVAAVTAIVALAEESREYRNEMAKLDTAFQENGHSSATATKTYEALQSVLGETEQAVEAANHLAKLTDNEKDLEKWTDICTGVYATFGASLPIEGLTEAANETAKVGSLTGSLADALNWAGVNEEKFQEQLDACSNEQERQQLITKTLTKLYSGAADQFKKTNKEVIRANQATEKWNKATAKVGKTVEPVVTDIKELGVVLLEDASEPLEDIASFIRKDVIPAIKSVSSWVRQNGPIIKSTLVGVTSAMVAYKVATIATEVAQKGLKGAIVATTVAQNALNLAQKASPIGLAVTAVVGLTAAIVALELSTIKAAKPVNVLTDEEKALADAADEAAASFRDQQAATQDTVDGINAQMGHVSHLAVELKALASASGRVNKEDQARAQFILNELNEALGTEYKMVDGVIQQYGNLKASIEEVIKTKKAKLLLEAYEADYVTAIKEKDAALDNLMLKEKEHDAQQAQLLEREQSYTTERENIMARIKGAQESGNIFEQGILAIKLGQLDKEMEKERQLAEDKKTEWEKTLLTYNNYTNQIINYEDAQTAALSGNYDEAMNILARKGSTYGNYSKRVSTETAKVLDALYLEAVEAGRKADLTKQNFENGVNGFTKEMVTEAEKGYEDAMKEFSTAYADAEGVGKDMGKGMSKGMENERGGLLKKAKSLVTGIISAMRKEADSHSPARKTIDFGEDVGEGAEIGIENKTKDVKKAATNQAAEVLDAYRTQEVDAQKALRSVAEQQTARQTSAQMTAAASNGPLLEKILVAIEKGQILTIDGDALVGATANSMDNALGRRRALAARGAL